MLITQPVAAVPAAPKPARVSPLTDVQLSHLRGKAGSAAAASCHAVRYRLNAPVDLIGLREKFEDAIKSWLAQQDQETETARMPKLWIEAVPGAAESPAGQRQRTAELMRPVELLDGPPCRAVLLQYQDRAADFIVVAHRAVLDRQALLWIAGAPFRNDGETIPCASGAAQSYVKPEALACEQYLNELRNGSYASRADWGMGNERDNAERKSLHQRADFKEGVDAASFLAAVGLVLARYSGQTAPVIAALAAHADEPESIGAHEGIALVPLSCETALPAGELLEKTAQKLSSPAWYTATLAGNLATSCENRGEVLVGVLFAADHQAHLGGVVADEYVPCLASPFPLTITVTQEKGGGYRINCHFRQKEFAASVVTQFMNAVVRVHGALRRHTGATLAAIDMLSQLEREQVAQMGRPSQELVIPDERIEYVFTRRAMQTPQATALTCGEDRLTYRELEEHSNRMAQALRDCGVRDGDRVGVCMDRSLELVEVLLAILKAGAAYVPMDPTYPVDRIAYTISDAQISIVIASAKGLETAKDVRVLEPQELLKLAPRRHEAPLINASASDAAYVIYTSGSTGRPKGVVVPHRNVVALLAATTEDFGLSAQDTWTLFHSSAFDFSVWEIWGCLLTGGHLVVAPYWITRNPEEFAELLAKERVTVLNQTPSAFAQLLDVDRNHPVTSTLRLVIFGGEPLDARMLLPWFDRHPEFECRLVNMFGITETTVHVTLETITREHALSASRSVGHAMPGWYYYVMDEEGRPLPPGIAGEIYVGGAGVAQYYLNRPELTAQRFVPDPYTGERIYRSGDKGRLRPDGRLEHLGRLDTQVKIRGFRIELDEIRSMLLEAPGVHTAAVVVHQDDPRDTASARLCAYVVLKGGNISEVRGYIARMLPEYMVPASLIEMPALPLTQNGKLDAKRLPAPSRNGHRHNDSPPANAVAEKNDELAASMLQIWETVLGVPVGLDDNFFDLGGNSLYAMRIATAMRNQGLPALPVRELYVQQTIRRLGTSLKR
jgi:amino acid adenylation domain-containing protein